MLADDLPFEDAVGGDVEALGEIRRALVGAFGLTGTLSVGPGVNWNGDLKYEQTFDGLPVPHAILVRNGPESLSASSTMRNLSSAPAPVRSSWALETALDRQDLADRPAAAMRLQYVHPLTSSQVRWANELRPEDVWGVFFPAWVGPSESGLSLCIDAYSGESVLFGI